MSWQIGTQLRTTQEWSDEYADGEILHGELIEVRPRGMHPRFQNRTHVLRLPRIWRVSDTYVLTLDPRDLELDPSTDEVLATLEEAFHAIHVVREDLNDPAARGVKACLDYIRQLRGESRWR